MSARRAAAPAPAPPRTPGPAGSRPPAPSPATAPVPERRPAGASSAAGPPAGAASSASPARLILNLTALAVRAYVTPHDEASAVGRKPPPTCAFGRVVRRRGRVRQHAGR